MLSVSMPVGLCLSSFVVRVLFEDIFWNMPFKNPTHADRVIMLIIFIMLVMRIMVIKDDYAYYSDYVYFGSNMYIMLNIL